MDAKQFVELVSKMRMFQNAYYRNGRKQSDLIASKEMEKAVDRALLAGIAFPEDDTPNPSPIKGEGETQGSLFE